MGVWKKKNHFKKESNICCKWKEEVTQVNLKRQMRIMALRKADRYRAQWFQ